MDPLKLAAALTQALQLISLGTEAVKEIHALSATGGATDADLDALMARIKANSAVIQGS